MPYFFIDYYYIILVLPAIIFSLIIQAKLKGTYAKYAKLGNERQITGAQAAQIVLNYYGITNVNILQGTGKLTDHYDPAKNIISLSPEVFGGSSIAAVGIACHEAGHAAQYAQSYVPIKLRNLILPVCNIGSSLSMPLLLIGLFLSYEPLIWIGIGFFSFVVVFQLVTLPVEFNASRRAISVIESNNILSFEEKLGATKVLKAAALTYVAALAVSVAQLLRLIFRFTGRRD